MILTYTLIYSVYSSMGAIVGIMNDKFEYRAWLASIGGGFFIIFGIAGIFTNGYLADKF